MLQRKHLHNRTEWLSARKSGIGASDAAAIVGVSGWMTASDLFNIKTGRTKPKEVSNDLVSRGVRMEKPLRELYKSMHPEYKVTHHPYDMLYQKERPWLFATLDGEVVNGKKKGILEIKTAAPRSTAQWDEWREQIPKHYMTQVTHQLIATDFDFVDLFAALENREGDWHVRTYHFDKEMLNEDMTWLLFKETEFWKSLEADELPALTLTF